MPFSYSILHYCLFFFGLFGQWDHISGRQIFLNCLQIISQHILLFLVLVISLAVIKQSNICTNGSGRQNILVHPGLLTIWITFSSDKWQYFLVAVHTWNGKILWVIRVYTDYLYTCTYKITNTMWELLWVSFQNYCSTFRLQMINL